VTLFGRGIAVSPSARLMCAAGVGRQVAGEYKDKVLEHHHALRALEADTPPPPPSRTKWARPSLTPY